MIRPGPHAHEAGPIAAGFALLTVSDSRTPQTDRSGATARRLVEEAGHRVAGYDLVPDDPPRVAGRVVEWLADPGVDLVVVNGGTGISPRDRTYEAVAGLLERRLDGFGELFRALSYAEIGSAAMLSRAVGGLSRRKPLFSLPGSPAAVELGLCKLILPEVGHLLAEIRKEAPPT